MRARRRTLLLLASLVAILLALWWMREGPERRLRARPDDSNVANRVEGSDDDARRDAPLVADHVEASQEDPDAPETVVRIAHRGRVAGALRVRLFRVADRSGPHDPSVLEQAEVAPDESL
ncbi:MAG: hypothetical protein AAGD14_05310, partial [Planctomycetota bacterium]